jgi:hypothetical protein
VKLASYGAKRKHVAVQSTFRLPPGNGHSQLSDPAARFALKPTLIAVPGRFGVEILPFRVFAG